MEKKQYIIPEIGINVYNFSLLRSDESPVMPPTPGGAPERKDPKF
jgi:hypothetical protein